MRTPMSVKKLYNILPKDFELISHVGLDNNVVPRPAGELPFIYWPNDVPCIEANIYMGVLLRRSVSLRNGGGTAATYAKNISHFIRFCFENNWGFLDLDDNRFTIFINGLQARDLLGEPRRESTQILKIGRVCIDFLRTVQSFHGKNDLIGEKNCAITVNEREVKVVTSKGRSKSQWVWSHDSFPKASPLKTRLPIGLDTVAILKSAAQKTADKALRCRKELMIACFEQTGARVGEVDLIRVIDIEAAHRDKGSAPMLRLATLKKRGECDHFRFVPVPRMFIQQAMKYIQRYRRRIVRGTIGSCNDHGFLLVSHNKGTKLASGTLANEISDLCKVGGITDQAAHWHLFRHAYITQKLKAIILQYDIANQDEFRKALLNAEAFKQQLQQWTGHTNLSSLDVYINLAFAELSNMDKTYSAVHLGSAVGVLLDRLDSLKANIVKDDSAVSDLMAELEEMVEAFQEDIDHSVRHEITAVNDSQ